MEPSRTGGGGERLEWVITQYINIYISTMKGLNSDWGPSGKIPLRTSYLNDRIYQECKLRLRISVQPFPRCKPPEGTGTA